MNKILFCSILSIFSPTLFSQSNPPSLHWEKNINGVVNGNNQHIKTIKDASGNFYSLSLSDDDFKVIKFNSSGVIQNVCIYNNPYNQFDFPSDVVVDASENVYVCGKSFIDYKYYNTIVKFNSSGNLIWSRNLLTTDSWIYPTDVTPKAMTLDNSGNVLFTGNMNDSLTIGKISPMGDVLFTKTIFIDGIGIGTGNDIVTDASGAFFVAGFVNNASGNKDCVIFKTDQNGNFVWRKTYAGIANADDMATYLAIDNSSNLYVAGQVADLSSTNTTATLVKLNASGAQQWLKSLTGTGQIEGKVTALYVDGVGQNYIATNITTATNVSYTNLYKHSSAGVNNFTTVVDDPALSENKTTSIDIDLPGNVFIGGYDPWLGTVYYGKYTSAGSQIYYYLYTTPGNLMPVTIFADNSSSPNVVTTIYSNIYNIRYNASGVFQYENVYAGSGNGFDEGVKIITQGNQSIYTLGTLSNATTQADILLGKYDAQGNILWQNIIDYSSTFNGAYDFDNDDLFNIYTLGSGMLSTYHSRYDSTGAPMWVNNYPGTFNKIIVDGPGNSYIAGGNNSGIKFSIKKINAAGGTAYSNIPSAVSDTVFSVNSVDIDATNRLYVGGTRYSDQGSATPNMHCVVQKFGTLGSLNWTHVINHCDSVGAYSYYFTKIDKILVDASNDVYVLGRSSGYTSGFPPSFVFLIKLDNSGNQIWRQDFTGSGVTSSEYPGDMTFSSLGTILLYTNTNNHIVRRIDKTDGSIVAEVVYYDNVTESKKIEEDAVGNIFVAGNCLPSLATLRDYAIAKFDPALNFVWTQHYSNTFVGNDEVGDMAVTGNNRIYVTGRSFSTPGTQPDFNLIKLCDIVPPTISSTGPVDNICPGTSIDLITSGSNYLWSNGSTTPAITVNTAGNYFCTVSKSDGCAKNTDTLNVSIKPNPITPEICMVTVDDSSTHNIVYWDKTLYSDIDYFNIYREDFTSSYTLIANVPYDSLSEYHDYAINPNVTTKRYKISAVDTCGTESALSNYHNTLYCTDLGSGQFFWNLYEIESSANPVVNYIIMRQDTIGAPWVELDSTAGTQQTLNDPTFASFPYASWRVKTYWGISCTPTRAGISTSRSNLRNKNLLGGGTEINNSSLLVSDVKIYPNPSNSTITISMPILNCSVNLFDATGRIIYSFVNSKLSTEMDISYLANGVYYFEINDNTTRFSQKFVKN